MKVKFMAEAIGKGIGKGKGGYRGKIVERQERSFDEIVEAASQRVCMSKAAVLAAVTGIFEEMIEDSRKTARVQKLGDIGKFAINLHGQFRGVNDVYDPDRQTLDMTFERGKKIKKISPKFALENKIEPETIKIDSIMGDGSLALKGGCSYMSWGDDTTCNGVNVKMHEGDEVVWSVTIDGKEYSGPCEVYSSTPATLDFHWPKGIPRAAVGRDILLCFHLHGSRPDNAPVEVRRWVKLMEKLMAKS